MPSDIDICNLALARLGDSATVASIAPPEGSVQAEHCARFYPLARNALLEMHPWGFATRRVRPARLEAAPPGWAYAFALPSDSLRVIDVIPCHPPMPEGFLSECGFLPPVLRPEFSVEDGKLLTNIEDFTLIYTFIPRDASGFPPLVVEALSWLLASHLAGPLVKGDSGAKLAQACYQTFRVAASSAIASDAKARRASLDFIPSGIRARL
jgi:hypothetical protein